MKSIYIIDASGYIYRSYFAIRNITNAKGESTNALFGFIRSVSKLIADFHPEHIVAVFDGPQSTKAREAIYTEYKAHRPGMPDDLLYQIQWAHDYCKLRGIPMLSVSGVEADDTMGSIAVWAAQHQAKAYLCTSDKDMSQLVNDQVFILNTFKDNLIMGAKEVEEAYGVPPNKLIDFFAITGDTSDNVPGVPGFGPKTAAALLQQFGSLDYILAHPEEISNKKKQDIIIQEAEKARISRQLVTVITDVDIPHDEKFYRFGTFNKEPLKEFYVSKNFNSLIKDLEKETTGVVDEKPAITDERTIEYNLIDDEASLEALVKDLSHQKEIGFVTETTDSQPLKSELVGIGFCYKPGRAWYIPVNGKLGLDKIIHTLKPLFENPKIGFYGHNVKYDLHVLSLYGIQVAHISFDTILASYLLNSHSRKHSLETLILEYFGKVKIAISELVGKGKKVITMREVPIEQVCTYCCEDADFTCCLKEILEKQLKERNLYHLLNDIELPLLKVLLDVERKGIYLNRKFLEELSLKVNKQLKIKEREIYEMAGEEFNLNSPKQLSDILFKKLGINPPKKTATGHSTSADVLEALQNQYPIASKMMEYRVLEKLRSTYVDTLPLEIHPKTHRIHCTFNQSVAATGRLSCQDPNLQNIPVRSEWGIQIREAFRPEKEGWSYLAADYSQIELRLLAHLSEDPTLLTAFKNHEDIHVRTAAAIFNIPLEKVTKELRHQAKAVNFGVVYGQGPFGLSQVLGIDMKDAKVFIDMYFKQYGKVREYLEASKEAARKTGRAVTLTGRERLIPEIHSKNMQIRAAAERLAINTPLQGTAADLIKLAMIQIHERLQKERKIGYMVLQIHDELIFEIPDFEIISIEPMVREIMQKVFKLKVPLIVDISIGKNWKEC